MIEETELERLNAAAREAFKDDLESFLYNKYEACA